MENAKNVADASAPTRRFAFLDSLRGVAATMVVVFHLYGVVSPDPTTPLAGSWLDFVLRHMDSGVHVFFVISGCVILLNVDPAKQVTRAWLWRFMLRRSVRLDPPYWLMIVMYGAVLVLSGNSRAGDLGPGTVVLNMLYLDNLTGVASIVPIGWTLCLELQFYLILAVALGAAQLLAHRVGSSPAIVLCLLPSGLWSAAIAADLVRNPMQGLFLSHWYLFLLGAGAGLLVVGERVAGWILVGAMSVAALANAGQVGPAVALCAAVAIVIAWSAKQLEWALGGRVLQYLGKISYSLYLVHPLVGSKALRLAVRVLPSTAAPHLRWACVAGGVIVSVAAAHVLWALVERPAQRWARRHIVLPSRARSSLEPAGAVEFAG